MKQQISNSNTNDLLKAILSLKTVSEAQAFFRDLCTLEEIKSMSERWQMVKLLDQGLTYRQIADKLGASTTTVTRVANWLNNGAGGYRLALNQMHHSPSSSKKG